MRHLIKPNRMNMALITVIRTGINIAKKAGYLYRRIDYTNPVNKLISKYVPPAYRRNAFRIQKVAETALVGGLLYDIIDLADIAIPKKPQTYQKRQTRNNMVQPGSRYRNRYAYNSSRFRCPPKRKKFGY